MAGPTDASRARATEEASSDANATFDGCDAASSQATAPFLTNIENHFGRVTLTAPDNMRRRRGKDRRAAAARPPRFLVSQHGRASVSDLRELAQEAQGPRPRTGSHGQSAPRVGRPNGASGEVRARSTARSAERPQLAVDPPADALQQSVTSPWDRRLNVWDEIYAMPGVSDPDLVDAPPAFAAVTATRPPDPPVPNSPPPPFTSDRESDGDAESEPEAADPLTLQQRAAWEADRMEGYSLEERVARMARRMAGEMPEEGERRALAPPIRGEQRLSLLGPTARSAQVSRTGTVRMGAARVGTVRRAGPARRPPAPITPRDPSNILQVVRAPAPLSGEPSEAPSDIESSDEAPAQDSSDSESEWQTEHDALEALRRYDEDMRRALRGPRLRGIQNERAQAPGDPAQERLFAAFAELDRTLPRAPPPQVQTSLVPGGAVLESESEVSSDSDDSIAGQRFTEVPSAPPRVVRDTGSETSSEEASGDESDEHGLTDSSSESQEVHDESLASSATQDAVPAPIPGGFPLGDEELGKGEAAEARPSAPAAETPALPSAAERVPAEARVSTHIAAEPEPLPLAEEPAPAPSSPEPVPAPLAEEPAPVPSGPDPVPAPLSDARAPALNQPALAAPSASLPVKTSAPSAEAPEAPLAPLPAEPQPKSAGASQPLPSLMIPAPAPAAPFSEAPRAGDAVSPAPASATSPLVPAPALRSHLSSAPTEHTATAAAVALDSLPRRSKARHARPHKHAEQKVRTAAQPPAASASAPVEPSVAVPLQSEAPEVPAKDPPRPSAVPDTTYTPPSVSAVHRARRPAPPAPSPIRRPVRDRPLPPPPPSQVPFLRTAYDQLREMQLPAHTASDASHEVLQRANVYDREGLASLEAYLERAMPSVRPETEGGLSRSMSHYGGAFTNPRSSAAPLPSHSRLPTITAATRHFPPTRTYSRDDEAAQGEDAAHTTPVRPRRRAPPPPPRERDVPPVPARPSAHAEAREALEAMQGSVPGIVPASVPDAVPAVPAVPAAHAVPAAPVPAVPAVSTEPAAVPSSVPVRGSVPEHVGMPVGAPVREAVRAPVREPVSVLASEPATVPAAVPRSVPAPPAPAPIPSLSEASTPSGPTTTSSVAGSDATVPPSPLHAPSVTDLDVAVAQLDNPSMQYEWATLLGEFLGPASAASSLTQEELQSIPVGRVELEHRRVSSSGKVKQKLSVVGVRVDRCGICLNQFREGQLACIFPCVHMYVPAPNLDSTTSAQWSFCVPAGCVPSVVVTW